MNLDQTVKELNAFVGSQVEVEVWGLENDAAPVVFLAGIFRGVTKAVELPTGFGNALGSEALMFQLGTEINNHVSLWPDRFVRGERLGPREGIEVITRDGRLRIHLKSRPWID